jgi:polysaccharide export outer membrane protein
LSRQILNGDRLRINVIEAPEMSREYAVAGDGTVDLELIGRIEIAGLTAEEASSKVEKLLEKDYFRQATVSVDVSAFVEGDIIVNGEVKNPGEIPFKGDQIMTLTEAILKVGGLLPSANGREVRILRWKPGAGMDRQIITVDVKAIFEKLAFDQDQFLRPRDIIVVPSLGQGEGAGEFLALGEVQGVGFHLHQKGMDVVRALSVVGGVTKEANLADARILRPNPNGGYTAVPIDLARLLTLADMTQNAPLLPGDIFFVPSATQTASGRIYLLGQVAQPGAYPLPSDKTATLARLILAYGGLPRFADGKHVKVIRSAPDGTKQTLKVDVETILKTGDLSKDVPIKNEDVIIVPDAGPLGLSL